MKTELEFLEYVESQLVSSGEKVYTAWLEQEIKYRKQELNDALNVKVEMADE